MRLRPAQVLAGYANGIFPMAESRNDPEIFWVDPRRRGVLPLDGFHISRSLRRRMRAVDWSVSVNTDFAAVVQGCADRAETWISDAIAELYQELHHMGYAHSVEIWQA